MKYGLLQSLAIYSVLGCTALFANEVPSVVNTSNINLTVGITGLYLQPDASNLVYGVYTTPLPLPAPNWAQRLVNPEHSGAFDLELKGNLNVNNNARLNWLHFNSNDSDSAGSSPATSVGPVYYYGPAEQFLLNTAANSKVKFDVDHLSLVFGHTLNITKQLTIDPFFGFSAVYLKENISNNYMGTDPVYGPYTHAVYQKSNFTGFGPRFGVDGTYSMSDRFGILGGLGGNLLAGFLKYSTNFKSWTGYIGETAHNNIPANTSMANETINRIVPEVDAKIALVYKTAFASPGSELTFKLGYLYAVYLNAFHQVLPSTLVSGSWEAGSVAIVTQSQQDSNLDLQGPFLSVTWNL